MVTEVALVAVQVKVELPPEATAVGCAEIVTVGGTWFTVTVALVVVQVSVLNCPAVIVVGDAARVAVTLPGGGGVLDEPPTLPHPAMAMVNNKRQIKL